MNTIFTKARFLVKDLPKPLGRWKIDNSIKQLNYKIDLTNEDHCGPCGQYKIEKVEVKKERVFCDDITLVANTLT
jgi:hypothetical protein